MTTGMGRVRAAIFSLTPPTAPDDDGSYLRWHLLDHMPEQYQLPGIVLGQRWTADGDYLTSRLAGDGPFADAGNVVTYLVGDPVQATIDDFMTLGGRLAKLGRFPERRPSLGLRMLAAHGAHAAPQALISPEVVPFRPHRGVLLVIEEPTEEDSPAAWWEWLDAEHHPALLEVPGTAGAWTFRSTDAWRLPSTAQGSDVYATIIYLDEDPLTTTRALATLVEQRWSSGAVRPLFAGPLRSMIDWEAWR